MAKDKNPNPNEQHEDGKKKSNRLFRKIRTLILILILIAAILVLLNHLGLGFGLGTGTGKDSGTVKKTADTAQSDDTTEPTTDYIDYLELTVSGSSYIYRNSEYSLDDLISELKTEEDIRVRIRDDNASKAAYDSLVSALNENGIPYAEESSETEETTAG